jgi:hypothetical protein
MREGHEPGHTLRENFRAYVAGGAAQEELRLKNSK